MVKTMKAAEKDAILQVADLMVLAAKTAPKGSGRDTVEAAVITGEDKDRLRDHMIEMQKRMDYQIFVRDAGNVDESVAVVVIGMKDTYFGLTSCGMCGAENCGKAKKAGVSCVFNMTDTGIAVGSAVSVAADHRVDNRVMYTVGRAALEMGFLSDQVKTIVWGIPLYAGSKDITFDRAPGSVVNAGK